MIDPIIFSFNIGSLTFALHWYGLIIAIAVMIGLYLAERQINRLGGNGEKVWDALLWMLVLGIIGARLWYVFNDIAGGGTIFTTQSWAWIRIWEGGLHIWGAVLGGLLGAWVYCRRNNYDFWMLMDGLAIPLLVAQAFGRIGNFINQELYGPPTDLPWGVKIAAENRLFPWNDLVTYPVETTRFHPTFFYESIWNLVMAGLILFVITRFANRLKPGAIFYMWVFVQGLGRTWLEIFRPDQPRIPGTDLSYSRLIAIIMVVVSLFALLERTGVLRLAFKMGPDHYLKDDKKWKSKKAV